ASRRAADLHKRATDLGLKVDHRKTEALYLPPRGKNAKKIWRNPTRITVDTPLGPVRPQKEMRWLGPGKNGNPVSTNIKSALHELETAASKALRKTMPIWRTVPRQIPFWLAGIAPPEILGRETARTAARLHTLPGNHPL
ncbi:hypothetical protein B0H65DRAFT_388779, partial [Neurospora tetraspora]